MKNENNCSPSTCVHVTKEMEKACRHDQIWNYPRLTVLVQILRPVRINSHSLSRALFTHPIPEG
jgi:hypothetical protein